MPLLAQIRSIDNSGDNIQVWGILLASGTYTSGQGGDWVNLTRQAVVDGGQAVAAATLDPSFTARTDTVDSSQPPLQFDVWSMAGQNQYVYTVNVTNTTNPSNLQVKLSASATLNSEFATGAYPAAVTADIIAFYATFPKLK